MIFFCILIFLVAPLVTISVCRAMQAPPVAFPPPSLPWLNISGGRCFLYSKYQHQLQLNKVRNCHCQILMWPSSFIADQSQSLVMSANAFSPTFPGTWWVSADLVWNGCLENLSMWVGEPDWAEWSHGTDR